MFSRTGATGTHPNTDRSHAGVGLHLIPQINWEAQKDQQSIIEVATGVLPKEVDANKRKQRDAIKRSTFNHYNKIEGMLSWLEARQGNASDIVMMVDA